MSSRFNSSFSLFLAVFYTLLLTTQVNAEVRVQPAAVAIDSSTKVKAGQYTYYELLLNRGERLNLKFKIKGGTNHSANVWFLDSTNFSRFKAGQQFSYQTGSSGSITKYADYAVNVSKTNYYYLVLDNRNALIRSRYIDVKASREFPQHTPRSKAVKEAMEVVYSTMKEVFNFKDFNITVQLCGTENAFSSPDITMCWELIEKFNQENVPLATQFVFYHELGHSLLNIWGYPTYDNEDVADEFAVLMTLLNKKKEMSLDAAKFWLNQPNHKQEALGKLYIDDRHTISPQRARNIINWVNNEDKLLNRWITILAPQMTDKALLSLKVGGPFRNKGPILQELSNRNYNVD